MSNILIIGDSFAADWSTKYKDYLGWPNLLAEQHTVTNLAQAGVSEYKIYKQLLSVKDLSVFDAVIVAHTSPYRVPTRLHPVHFNDSLHKDADLIYADIAYHSKRIKNIFNRSLRGAYEFYNYHYDSGFFEDSYCLFRIEINRILEDKQVITLSTFNQQASMEANTINLVDMLVTYPGLINHYSEFGNRLVYGSITSKIQELV